MPLAATEYVQRIRLVTLRVSRQLAGIAISLVISAEGPRDSNVPASDRDLNVFSDIDHHDLILWPERVVQPPVAIPLMLFSYGNRRIGSRVD
jgi:hypothetical protein